MRKLVIGIVLVNFLAACASDPKKEEVAAAPAPKAESAKSATASATTTEVDLLNDPNSILANRSAYYPFDVAVVQDEDKPMVQAHAKYLGENSNRSVRLEGNCDERGSNEYNLGLGQRRADGVKKMLEAGGARAGQLDSVSYGEEKPRCTDHNEDCWKQNRRTDLNYAR
jgi:peptidoglycan-associated lipoprotein